jgi:hypothetical protein
MGDAGLPGALRCPQRLRDSRARSPSTGNRGEAVSLPVALRLRAGRSPATSLYTIIPERPAPPTPAVIGPALPCPALPGLTDALSAP